MMIYTSIAVGGPPLRLYIVAIMEATLIHFIIHDKMIKDLNDSTNIE